MSSTTRTGIPTRSPPARSIGTEMYASRPPGLSTVVSSVETVTRSPTRTGMSPTIPAAGDVTRW